MDFLYFSLILSTFLCSLATGFILTFASVVMPGLSELEDKDFLKAFQVTDGVIQNNQPIFMLVWLGSIISVLATILICIISFGSLEAWLIIFVGVTYLLGVQGITVSVHLPLNNRIKKLDINNMAYDRLKEERINFENKWNYFNNIRTAIAFSVSLAFLLIVTML